MIREVKIRERIHHPNIVDYKHSWLEMHRANRFCPWVPWLFVLMEYCNGGNVEDLVWDRGIQQPPSRYLSDLQIWKLLLDIILGLQTLHHARILYRDMKCANILWNYTVDNFTGKQECSALLSDFGTSELLSDNAGKRGRRNGYTGTVEYAAPELLEADAQGHFRDDYDVSSDMWSLGILLHAMCYAKLPFVNDNPVECRQLILNHSTIELPNVPERSPTLKHLIKALLAKDPARRPSTDDILRNPLVRQVLLASTALQLAGEQLAAEGIRLRGNNEASSGAPECHTTFSQRRSTHPLFAGASSHVQTAAFDAVASQRLPSPSIYPALNFRQSSTESIGQVYESNALTTSASITSIHSDMTMSDADASQGS